MASAILTACKAIAGKTRAFFCQKFNEEELYVGGEKAEQRTKAQNCHLSLCELEFDVSNNGNATHFGVIYCTATVWTGWHFAVLLCHGRYICIYRRAGLLYLTCENKTETWSHVKVQSRSQIRWWWTMWLFDKKWSLVIVYYCWASLQFAVVWYMQSDSSSPNLEWQSVL